MFCLPGLAISEAWNDFWKNFTIGRKEYSLKELKNINASVKVGKLLSVLDEIFAVMINLISIFHYVAPSKSGVVVFILNISIAVIPIFLCSSYKVPADSSITKHY